MRRGKPPGPARSIARSLGGNSRGHSAHAHPRGHTEPHMRRIIGPALPPPSTTPGRGSRPPRRPSAPRFPAPGGCAWALGEGKPSEAAGHRTQRAASRLSPDSTPAGAIAPRSPSSPPAPRHYVFQGLRAFPQLLHASSSRPRTPHAASPRVLELNEGEGRSPAAVLQVDVTDGAVFVKHVLDVLGSDVRR